MPVHSTVELLQSKDKLILQAAKKINTHYFLRAKIQLTADYSKEMMEVNAQWKNIFKTMGDYNCQPIIIYLANKMFPDTTKRSAIYSRTEISPRNMQS